MANQMAQIMGAGGNQASDLPQPGTPPETLGSVLPMPGGQPMPQQSVMPQPMPGPAPQSMAQPTPTQQPLPGMDAPTFDPQTGKQDTRSKMMEDDKAISQSLTNKNGFTKEEQALLDGIGGEDAASNKSFWEGKDGGVDPGHIAKFYAAQMRANLFPDNKEKHFTVAQSMWGDDNARVGNGGEIEYRPAKDEEWRKFNQPMIGEGGGGVGIPLGAVPGSLVAAGNDYEARHLLKSMGDWAGTLMGGLAASESGSPTMGAGAFSATQNIVDAGIIKLTDMASSKAISDPATAVANKMLWEMGTSMVFAKGLSGVAEAGGMLARTKLGREATANLVNGLKDSSFAPSQQFLNNAGASYYEKGVKEAGARAIQAASWVENFVNVNFPNLSDKISTVGNMIEDANSYSQKFLGEKVGAIKNDIIQLADSTESKVNPQTSLAKAKEILTKYDVKFAEDMNPNSLVGRSSLPGQILDPSGELLGESAQTIVAGGRKTVTPAGSSMSGLSEATPEIESFGASKAVGRPSRDIKESDLKNISKGTIKDIPSMKRLLANYYDKLFRASNGLQGGIDAAAHLDDVDQLQRLAYTDKSGDSAIDGWMKQMAGAAGSDRNEFINDLVQNHKPSWSEHWQNGFTQYANRIEAIGNVKAALSSKGSIANLVNALSGGGSSAKITSIDNIKNAIGEDSELWNNFRGELFNSTVNKFVDQSEGSVNLVNLKKFMAADSNAPQLEQFLKPEEKATFLRGLSEMKRMMEANQLSESQGGLASGLAKIIGKMGMDKVPGAKTLIKLTGQSRTVLDFLRDDGMVSLIKTESDPIQKQNLINLSQGLEDFMDQMKIVEVPTSATPGLGKGTVGKSIQRYMPYVKDVAEGK